MILSNALKWVGARADKLEREGLWDDARRNDRF